MSLFAELKRRNVFRVAVAYVIIGWLVMQVGEVMAPALHLPDWVLSALAFFIILGFPFAMFFAWAFELTPEGIKREKEVERDQSISPVTGRKLDFAIIALLVLALGYFVADKFWLQPRGAESQVATATSETTRQAPTIAVLPLVDMSPQGDSEYFSDGLTEELLNILAKISELQVAGRTSSFAFKGQNEDLRVIGEKLNVNHILEGSVRKDDARNRVRITLQLIDTDNGYHLWSETYDRDLDDIFAIQEDVAHQVAAALRVTLLGEDEQRLGQLATTEVDAYDLYLQGTQELRKAGYVNLEKSVDLFQQVLAIDAGYVPARLGLVAAWGQMAGTGAITSRQAVERGLPMLEQVLETEPDNPRAQALHAEYLANGLNKPDEAEAAYQRALQLAPRDAATLADYGRFLYDNRQVDRGMALIDEAVSIEPLHIGVLFDQCQTRAHRGRFDDAMTACRRIQEIAPDGPQGYYGEALAYLYSGDVGDGIKGYVDAIQRDPEDYEMLAAVSLFWITLGDAEQARAWLQRAEALGAGQPIPVITQILFLEYTEQYDRAGELAWQALEQGLENRHGSDYRLRQAIAARALRTQDWERGLAPFRETYPWAFDTEQDVPDDIGDAVDDLLQVVRLMKSANPLSPRPEELMSVIETSIDDYHPGWGIYQPAWRKAALRALRDDPEGAVRQLEEARELGMFLYWRNLIFDHPVFMPLSDHPAFRQLRQELENEAERQRERAYGLLGIDS